MKKKLLLLLSLILCLCIAAACNKGGNNGSGVEINDGFTAFSVPDAYVGEVYDFEPYITKQANVTYAIKVEYLDETADEFIEIETDGFKFTPMVEASHIVTVTATSGSKTKTEDVSVRVSFRIDAIDEVLKENNYAASASEISKVINTDQDFVIAGGSSLRLASSGNEWLLGLGLDGVAVNEMFSYTNYDNAVIEFWVFNPNDSDLEFSLTTFQISKGIKIFWNARDTQIAAPGQWTHIVWSYRERGINTPFKLEDYSSPAWDENDHNNIQMRYLGSGGYMAYIDCLDITDYDAEKFPGLFTGGVWSEMQAEYASDLFSFAWDGKLPWMGLHDQQNKFSSRGFDYNETAVEGTRSYKAELAAGVSGAMLDVRTTYKDVNWYETFTSKVLSFYAKKDAGIGDIAVGLQYLSGGNITTGSITIVLGETNLEEGYKTAAVSGGWYKVQIHLGAAFGFGSTYGIRSLYFVFANNGGSAANVWLDSLKLASDPSFESEVDVYLPKITVENKDTGTKLFRSGMVSAGDGNSMALDGTELYNGEGLWSLKFVCGSSYAVFDTWYLENDYQYPVSGKALIFYVKTSVSSMTFLGTTAGNSTWTAIKDAPVRTVNLIAGTKDLVGGYKVEAAAGGWLKVTLDCDGFFSGIDGLTWLRVKCDGGGAANIDQLSFGTDNVFKGEVAAFHSKLAADTGDFGTSLVANGHYEINNPIGTDTVTLDESTVYGSSTLSLKLVSDGARRFVLSPYFLMNPVDCYPISGKALIFYVKTSVSSINILGNTVLDEDWVNGWRESLSRDITLTAGAKDLIAGYKVETASGGWLKVTLDCNQFFSGIDTLFSIRISCNGTIYFDQMSFGTDTGFKDEIETMLPKITVENNDAGTKLFQTAGGYEAGSGNTVTLDDTQLYNGEGLWSLKFVYGGANPLVLNTWTLLNNDGYQITGKALIFYVKTSVSSLRILGTKGWEPTYDAERIVNLTAGTKDVIAGYKVEAKADGWLKVTLDCDGFFTGVNASVDKITWLRIWGNAAGAINIDQMEFGTDNVFKGEVATFHALLAADAGDIGTGLAAQGRYPDSEGAVTLDTVNVYGGSTMSVKVVGGTLRLALYYLNEDFYPIAGKTISFYIKGLANPWFALFGSSNDGSWANHMQSEFKFVNITSADSSQIAAGWKTEAAAGGWFKITLDCDTFFDGVASVGVLSTIHTLYFAIDSGTIWIDGLAFGNDTAFKAEIEEAKDLATKMFGYGKEGDEPAPGYGVNGATAVLDSSVKYNDDGLYSVHVQSSTWAGFELRLYRLNNNDVAFAGKKIEFYLKLDGDTYRVGLMAKAHDGAWEEWPTSEYAYLATGGDVNIYIISDGYTITSAGNGWYKVSIDCDTAFGSMEYSDHSPVTEIFSLRFDINGSFWIDNMTMTNK